MNDLHPGMPLASADNYYVLSTTWQADASYAKNVYNWASGDFYLNAWLRLMIGQGRIHQLNMPILLWKD
jgi:hypothetical protein